MALIALIYQLAHMLQVVGGNANSKIILWERVCHRISYLLIRLNSLVLLHLQKLVQFRLDNYINLRLFPLILLLLLHAKIFYEVVKDIR